MNDEQHAEYFSVHRSVRYHDRRSGFFTTLHRITSGLTVLMAGTILLTINNSMPSSALINILSVIAAFFAATDVILGFSAKAELHRDLKREFNQLEQIMIESDDKPKTWLKIMAKRVAIQENESTPYRVLDVLCHNETVVALGLDEKDIREPGVLFVLTAHLIKWPNIGTRLTTEKNSSPWWHDWW